MKIQTILGVGAFFLAGVILLKSVKTYRQNKSNIMANKRELDDPKPKDQTIVTGHNATN
jgi:hypothetical protein